MASSDSLMLSRSNAAHQLGLGRGTGKWTRRPLVADIDHEAFNRIRALKIAGQKDALTEDLEFMAQYKYNSYEVYNPVKRFLPSLLEWLEQFQTPAEREAALLIVRQLVFLSRREILELSYITFQKILHRILDEIIAINHMQPFDYANAYRKLRWFVKSKCVFVAMSDGAQIDYFRRHATGIIENDRVLTYYKIDQDEILKLSKAEYAFLIDDMCASGTTFLGTSGDRGSIVNGQLFRFLTNWGRHVRFKAIFYCPYVITQKAHDRLSRDIRQSGSLGIPGVSRFDFDTIYGMCVPQNYSILEKNNELFDQRNRERVVQLCRDYYDRGVENAATKKGGGCKYGFGKVGIFLVRYNNTPNNTPSIIWFSSGERKSLFKRLARHYR
jgi:hypothetical protein